MGEHHAIQQLDFQDSLHCLVKRIFAQFDKTLIEARDDIVKMDSLRRTRRNWACELRRVDGASENESITRSVLGLTPEF